MHKIYIIFFFNAICKMLLILRDNYTFVKYKYYSITIKEAVIRHPRCFRQGALTPHSSANDSVDRVHGARRLQVVVGLEGRRYTAMMREGEEKGARGSWRACPTSEGPGHVPSPTRCMFCNLIMDLLVPVLAPLRLF